MPDANGLGILRQTYEDGNDEESSKEWEQIKNWVGAADKKAKHPISQLVEREQQKVGAYDEGGMAGDPLGSDPEAMKLLQPQGAGIIAPSAAPMPAAPQPAPAPMISKPAMVPPPVMEPAAAPAPAATDAAYQSEAAKTLGTTPEELKAFLTRTMTPTGGEMIGRAGASIAQGLSAAGGAPQDYLGKFNEQSQREKENLAGIPEKVSGLGKESLTISQQLQSRDPSSPYSKVIQNSNRQLLKSMGAKDSDIAAMSADAVNDVVGHQVTLQDALERIKQEGTYQRGMLGVQEEAQKTRRAEAETRGKEAEKNALEEVTKGSKIPFVGPSHSQKEAAFGKLGKLGGLDKGPLGETTVRNGKTYIWSPTSGAYHLQGSDE